MIIKKWIVKAINLVLFFSMMLTAHAETVQKSLTSKSASVNSGAILQIVPTSTTPISLVSNASADVVYNVTNGTKFPVSQLVLIANTNTSPAIAANIKTNTCSGKTLNPQGSCQFTLTLHAIGSAGKTLLTPKICIFNGTNCSIPVLANRIVVSIGSGDALQSIQVLPSIKTLAVGKTQAYTAIGIYTGGSTADITQKVIWRSQNTVIATISSTGLAKALSRGQTTITATLGNVTGTASLNVALFAYITNLGGRNISYCTRNVDGTFGICKIATGGATFNIGLSSAAIDPEANNLYVSDIAFPGRVYRCSLNNDGSINQCLILQTGIPSVFGLALNNAGSIMYVADPLSSVIQKCAVSSSNSFVCAPTGGVLPQPAFIALSETSNFAYISSQPNDIIAQCAIDPNNGNLSNCVDAGGGGFNGPTGLAINPEGTLAYIPNNNSTTISYCTIDANTGNFIACQTQAGFSNPAVIALDSVNQVAYISELGDNRVLRCTIEQNNGHLQSCAVTGTGFVGPTGIALAK